MTTEGETAADTGLLLFAHGARDGSGAEIAERVAEELRARRLFAEVAVSFAYQAPVPAEAIPAMHSNRVLVAPLLACNGRMASMVLPDLLADARAPGRWTLLPPVGVDPGIVPLAADLVGDVLSANGLDGREVAVLVVGHGISSGLGSQKATEALARGLDATGRYAEVGSVYLSQAPLAAQWQGVTAAEKVVVVPFFTSGGHHERRDLPETLRANGAALDGTPVAGRRVWLTPAIGRHPGLADLIQAQAMAALGLPMPRGRAVA